MSDIRFNRWLHQSGTGGVYQDSTGRVGIGTSVPTSALDVQSGTIKIGNNTLSSSGVSTFTTVSATTVNTTSITVSSGTTAAPSISPSGDSNTGIFFPAADTIAFGEGGVEVGRFDSSGRLGIGTANPSQKFEVVGGEIKAGRNDTSSEGGQVSFGRASDNNTGWYIDVYGSTSTPSLRFVDVSNAAVRATIDNNGNVLKPYQSFCDTGDTTSYNGAGSLTVIGASSAKGNWSSTVTNIGNNFSTSTDLYTCPASGAYAISCTCSIDNLTPAPYRTIFVLSINGGYEEITEVFDTYENQSPCVIRYCSANDTIGLGINGTGGSSFHVRLQVYFLG
jgi:hypothetical protein